MRWISQAIVIISATVAIDAGIEFPRASGDVVLSYGIDGVIQSRFIRAILLLTPYDLLRPDESLARNARNRREMGVHLMGAIPRVTTRGKRRKST